MPTYFYTAKSLDNQIHTGKLNATDERQLAQDLKTEGMFLIKATDQGEKKRLKLNFNLPFIKVPLVEKMSMVRNLGVMFATGIPLTKSFDILVNQARNKRMKDTLADVRERINKGSNLSEALSQYPDVFSDLFVNMVKVGEESGTLEEIFQILALQLQKEHELKSKIKNAMIYPSIILAVMMVVGIVIITFVLPNLKVFFFSLGTDIPIYTKILLLVGEYSSSNWHVIVLMPIFIFIFLFLTSKTKRGKMLIDTILLRTPVISKIIKQNNSAFLIRSLSSLISSGVPLIRSLEISSKTTKNHYFKEAILGAVEKVNKGEKLSNSLKLYKNLFPSGVIEMIEVGEETGKTSDVLKKLAEFYEQEAASSVERLTVIIEPFLIIILGLTAGFFVFSIIQPMYSSLQTIGQ